MKKVTVKGHKRGSKTVKSHTRKVKTAADKPGAGTEMKNRVTSGPDSYSMNDNQSWNLDSEGLIINNERPDVVDTRKKKTSKVAKIARKIIGATPNY